MTADGAPASDLKTQFKASFAAIARLAKDEWPTLDETKLAETSGDLEQAVALLATHLDRTKALVRKQLAELTEVARAGEPAASKNGAASNGATGPANAPRVNLPPLDDVFAAIRRLESFAVDEAKRVSDKVMPEAESRVRKNLWVSLLMALGFGLILGLWLNGGRRR